MCIRDSRKALCFTSLSRARIDTPGPSLLRLRPPASGRPAQKAAASDTRTPAGGHITPGACQDPDISATGSKTLIDEIPIIQRAMCPARNRCDPACNGQPDYLHFHPGDGDDEQSQTPGTRDRRGLRRHYRGREPAPARAPARYRTGRARRTPLLPTGIHAGWSLSLIHISEPTRPY